MPIVFDFIWFFSILDKLQKVLDYYIKRKIDKTLDFNKGHFA